MVLKYTAFQQTAKDFGMPFDFLYVRSRVEKGLQIAPEHL